MNLQIDRSGLHTVSDAVKEFAVKIGGYVESANSAVGFKTRNGLMAGAHVHLHLRVPSSQFRATMNYCRQLAAAEQDVLSESESVADVTEQYVDQSSRAAALTGTHQALLKAFAYQHMFYLISAVIATERTLFDRAAKATRAAPLVACEPEVCRKKAKLVPFPQNQIILD